MKQIASQHGFKYIKDCTCSQPGEIWAKGVIKLTIHSKQPTFLLKRPGNHNTSGRAEDLERVLSQFGI